MSGRRFAALTLVLVLCVGCGRTCAAPKPSGDDPSPGIDAAPTSGELPSRCEVEREIATTGDGLELGRMTMQGTRALIGARRKGRAMIAELDVTQPAGQVRFTDLGPAAGEAPPPLPLAAPNQVLCLGYESDASKHLHLVLRDIAAPSAVVAELAPEPPDDSLAFDALASDSGVLVAWDAPADDASAVFVATLSANGKASLRAAARVSPAATFADTPRLVRGPSGPIAVFLAHRPLPKTDAAALPEGPGEDLEHAWVEMQPLSADNQPSGPAVHLTAEMGAVATYDVLAVAHGADFDLIARDGVELGAGQGGKILLASVRNGVPTPSTPIAEHVGRGVPALFPGSPEVLLFADPSERGRSAAIPTAAGADSGVAFEPALDGARPLGLIPSGDPSWLRLLAVAAAPKPAQTSEQTSLRVLRCRR